MFHKNSGIEKNYGQERGRDGGREGGREGGIITFLCQKFLSHSTEKRRRGNLLCFIKFDFWHRKMLEIRGEGGASIIIFRQIVLSHKTESFRIGILLCF